MKAFYVISSSKRVDEKSKERSSIPFLPYFDLALLFSPSLFTWQKMSFFRKFRGWKIIYIIVNFPKNRPDEKLVLTQRYLADEKKKIKGNERRTTKNRRLTVCLYSDTFQNWVVFKSSLLFFRLKKTWSLLVLFLEFSKMFDQEFFTDFLFYGSRCFEKQV